MKSIDIDVRYIHHESKNQDNPTYVDNFSKYESIFVIISPPSLSIKFVANNYCTFALSPLVNEV